MGTGTWLTPLLGFALGLALPRGNTCAVRAARRFADERRIDWLVGLGVATSWAGLALIGSALLWPDHVLLPADRPITLLLLSGGVLLGLGTVLNDACFVGSIERLGSGDLGYLATLGAATLAMAVSPRLALLPMELGKAPGLRMLDAAWWWRGGLAVFAAVAVSHLWSGRATLRGKAADRDGQWPYPVVLMVLGLAGGLLFATTPNWSYGALLVQVSRGEVPAFDFGSLAALTLFAGAGVSAWLRGRFHVRLPRAGALLRRLAGGTLMGFAAALIPGGNDALGLWVVPGLALYGLAALATMVLTVFLVVTLERRLSGRGWGASSRAGTVSGR